MKIGINKSFIAAAALTFASLGTVAQNDGNASTDPYIQPIRQVEGDAHTGFTTALQDSDFRDSGTLYLSGGANDPVTDEIARQFQELFAENGYADLHVVYNNTNADRPMSATICNDGEPVVSGLSANDVERTISSIIKKLGPAGQATAPGAGQAAPSVHCEY